jgi:fatty aldehyde-generating acyl-ACP reductase
MDFALIGHPENWDAAAAVVGALRGSGLPPIPRDELESIVPWLPPRTVCRVVVRSTRGTEADGIYVDSFIPPDRLDARFARENLARVAEAAEYATKEGARVATLGGFSSILLEGRVERLPAPTRFTTGNTMTVALIVRGIERAAALARRDLSAATLLVIGATGDVGSGCARTLASRVGRLLLCARNPARLAALQRELGDVVAGTDAEALAREADFVICAASLATPSLLLDALPPSAIVCDAGYPKNIVGTSAANGAAVFFGGLCRIAGGFDMQPDLEGVLNRHPFEYVAHGCLAEGMALALERRFESFSTGRGGVTPERVEEMWGIAERHGIELAPLHDAGGSIEPRLAR